MHALLNPDQISKADQKTIADGLPAVELMERAGKAVADVVINEYPRAQSVLVICGLGNNGGDGFVTARALAEAGREVSVFIFGDQDAICGDVRIVFDAMPITADIVSTLTGERPHVIVDALLGAGLSRDVEGVAAEIIEWMNKNSAPKVSIDVPSGLDGGSGTVRGFAVRADSTVTFFREKPGHWLMPGRILCGTVFLRQIGIKESVLKETGVAAEINTPQIWRSRMIEPLREGHKYDRGHVLVLSGPATMAGASRLAAYAALRCGAGLVTVAASEPVVAIHASHSTSLMLAECNDLAEYRKILSDDRISTLVLGPGLTPDTLARYRCHAALDSGKHVVLDAGALSAFEADPEDLFDAIHRTSGTVVLTPHEGEFARLFHKEKSVASKLERAARGARRSGATVILKGPDTVIATPDKKNSISENAPPALATAGSGDVLTGIVAGFLAQGMDVFSACNCSVWLHGDAATRLGPNFISEEMDRGLQMSLKALRKKKKPNLFLV